MKTKLTKQTGVLASIISCLSFLMMISCLVNCQPNPGNGFQPLVTERQECALKDYTHVTDEVYTLTVKIDAPVEGPEALMDSITTFLNDELYFFFDDGIEQLLPYESVFSKDVKHLAEHYREAYAPFYFDENAEHSFSPCCLAINLVAQTNTYVTYAVNVEHIGEGIETMTHWATFVKSDGHRLGETISNEDMVRFYREHPGQRNNKVWDDHLLSCPEEDCQHDLVCSVGLLKDSLAHQYAYAPGIFEDMTYPLDSVAPYLSKEAQELIKK